MESSLGYEEDALGAQALCCRHRSRKGLPMDGY